MMALRFLIETNMKNTKIIRYEDLAAHPQETQLQLAELFGLRIAFSMNEFRTMSNNPSEAENYRSRKLTPNR
jgi:hypothetical protein